MPDHEHDPVQIRIIGPNPHITLAAHICFLVCTKHLPVVTGNADSKLILV